MQKHRKTKLTLLLGGFASIIVVLFLLVNLLQQSPLLISGWVGHTQMVYRELQAVLIAILDGETNQRGFVITGNTEYLKLYYNSKTSVDKHLHRLALLTRDNPPQQDRVGQLGQMLDNRYKELNYTLQVLQTEGRETAIDVVNSHVKSKNMWMARQTVNAMMNEEDRLLEIRNQRAYTLFLRIVFALGIIGLRDLIFLWMWKNEREDYDGRGNGGRSDEPTFFPQSHSVNEREESARN